MVDLVLTVLCVITVLVIVFAGCGATSKEEEVLDTLLLVARNVLQFIRLAAVMRQYVHICSHQDAYANHLPDLQVRAIHIYTPSSH